MIGTGRCRAAAPEHDVGSAHQVILVGTPHMSIGHTPQQRL